MEVPNKFITLINISSQVYKQYMANIPQIAIDRRAKKSVFLLKEDIKRLKSYRKTFISTDDFVRDMQMDRGTLNRIMELGRSSEVNANKIKYVLNSIKVLNSSN